MFSVFILLIVIDGKFALQSNFFRLVLDALCGFEDVNLNRMAVAICSILASKVSIFVNNISIAKSQHCCF